MAFSSKERLLLILLAGILLFSFRDVLKEYFSPASSLSGEPSIPAAPPLIGGGAPGTPPRPAAAPAIRPAERPSWAVLNEEGLSRFEQGDYQGALLLFSRALAERPGESVLQKNVSQAHASIGWEAVRRAAFAEAVPHFERAIRHFDEEPSYHVGHGLSLHRMRREEEAARALRTALTLNPDEITAHKILGEIYEGQNEFEKALFAWENVLRLDPNDPVLSTRLEKMRGESRLFSNFQSDGTRHFTLLFDGRERRDQSRPVLDYLEAAYREVGQALSYYPDKTIVAVLYADQQFRDVTKSPAWTKALFDGKIHLPVGGPLHDERLLRKLIYHEYTHALVHQLSRGKTPTWLNEGLALFFEGPDRTGALPPKSPLIPLEALHGSFMNYDASTAQQAYAESRSATAYLIDRHGLFRMKLLLEKLADAPSFAQAFEEVFLISYPDFQEEWQRKIAQQS